MEWATHHAFHALREIRAGKALRCAMSVVLARTVLGRGFLKTKQPVDRLVKGQIARAMPAILKFATQLGNIAPR